MNFITEETYKDFHEIANADMSESDIADATEDKLASYHAIAGHIYIIAPYLRRFRRDNRAVNIIIDRFKIQNIAEELTFLAIFCGNAHYLRIALGHLDKSCPQSFAQSQFSHGNQRCGWSQKVFSEIFSFAGKRSNKKLCDFVTARLSDSDYYAVSPILPERIRKYLRLFTESLYISGNNSAYITEIAQLVGREMMLFAADVNCDRALSLEIISILTASTAKSRKCLDVYFDKTAFWSCEFGKKLFRERCADDPEFIYNFPFDKDISKIAETFPEVFERDAITAGLKKHPASSLFVWMLRINRDWFTSCGSICNDDIGSDGVAGVADAANKPRNILPEFYPNVAEKLYVCSFDLSPDDIAGVFEYMISRATNDAEFAQTLQKNIVKNVHILTKDKMTKPKISLSLSSLAQSALNHAFIQRHKRLCVIAAKLIAMCDAEFSAVYCQEFRKKYDDFCSIYNIPADLAQNIRFV